jgi:hypothetical protein
MKVMASSLAAAFLLSLVPVVCHAQDFAADVVYIATAKRDAPSARTTTSSRSSKLYLSKDKMRLETRGLTETILLVNGEEHTSIALFPAQKAYQQLASVPSEYFRAQDAENACPDWQRVTDQKMACEKVGHEKVDGRDSVKYSNKSASDAGTSAVWIDVALKFVIKWQGGDRSAELHNIREGSQTAELFTVPAAYKVLQPQKASSKGFSPRSH